MTVPPSTVPTALGRKGGNLKKERLQVTQDRKADGGSGGRGGWSDKERET